MSTLTAPVRPPTTARGWIVERTTTVTREILVHSPPPRRLETDASQVSTHRQQSEVTRESTVEDQHAVGRVDQAIIRLGAWLIELGRRRAQHPGDYAEGIARRLDEAKTRDLAHFLTFAL